MWAGIMAQQITAFYCVPFRADAERIYSPAYSYSHHSCSYRIISIFYVLGRRKVFHGSTKNKDSFCSSKNSSISW